MQKKACRQISIETPDLTNGDNIFCFDVPVPDVPSHGAVIQVICAGVCYKSRATGEENSTPPASPVIKGIRDAALFPGFEVAGIIDQLGPDVAPELQLCVGQRVVVYPYEGLLSANKGYAEYISVPDAYYLVRLPDTVPMHVAATLPSGALWAVNAVHTVIELIGKFVAEKGRCNVLVVGTGGLALWIIRIAQHYLAKAMDQVHGTVAALKDDALMEVLNGCQNWNMVSWSEDVYESHLIERTKMACGGPVDIALDFGASQRSLSRILKCSRSDGVVLVGSESYETFAKKMDSTFSHAQVELREISRGSLEQLKELIDLVTNKQITVPPCNIFAMDNASNAYQKLSQSTIKGRAVIQFKKAD